MTPVAPGEVLSQQMVWPKKPFTIEPNEDLSEEIKRDFKEAASVVELSPRSACALLRLALEKLCHELGRTETSINDAIGGLVADGLIDVQVQEAMDILRVTGNNAVHPGTMSLVDDSETAKQLFEFLNIIANKTITQPKAIAEQFAKLPESKRNGIANRDSSSNS